jgi:ATP-binding cassette subfamily F protein uup
MRRRDRDTVLLEEMPPILNAQSLTKQFGAKPLFHDISLTVEDGDRIGLIGPNGAGKSTLLAILAGQLEPDTGELAVRKQARAAYVPQNSIFAPGLSIRQVLERALAATHVIESEREGRLRELSGRAGFTDLNAEAASLSGGWRKRLAITEALLGEPEVMLLDEPTNHLDLAGIEWLEALLSSASFAAVTVSHDRYFLESTSSEIIELNRVYADGLLRVKGNFSHFLEEKEAYLDSQSRQQDSLRNRVKTEIEWLRRGPKARAGKSKARIGTAHAMIGKLAAMDERTTVNTTGIDFEASHRKTKRLVEFKNVACDVPASPAEKAAEKLHPEGGGGFTPRIEPTNGIRGFSPGSPPLVYRTQLHSDRGHESGTGGPERQRQNHAAAPAAWRVGTGRRHDPPRHGSAPGLLQPDARTG